MAGISRANQRQGRVNKPRYDRYRRDARREKNKAYKLIRHLERFPEDSAALKALGALPEYCVKSARERLKKARGQS